MILRHLRANVVAYVALLLALTSTSYAAAQIADGSVTTDKLAQAAVTSAKIKDGQVKHGDLAPDATRHDTVKNRSLKAEDLEEGVIPLAARVIVRMSDAQQPNPDPDLMLNEDLTFSNATPTVAYAKFVSRKGGHDCSTGQRRIAMYLDGSPVKSSSTNSNEFSDSGYVQVIARIELPAGTHTLDIGIDCPTGVLGSHTVLLTSWTVFTYMR